MNTLLHTVETDERGLVSSCPHCGQRNRMTYERLGQPFRCAQCHQELSPPGEPVDVTSEAAFDALISRAAWPILVDFWAPWCGPCKTVAPELAKVAAEGSGRYLVAKVNTEELPVLAQRFGISGIPTLVIFKGGREVARQAGAMPAASIRRFLEPAL